MTSNPDAQRGAMRFGADVPFEDPSSSDEVISILPGVAILGVLRNLSYEPWYALAEYVDNAVQSAARSADQLVRSDSAFKLRVAISYESSNGGEIVITDNAAGIARSDFARAFRAAEVPPDRSGLSEFGMGMKSASIWFAKRWTVVTTSIGDPLEYTVSFDMQTVLAENLDSLQITSRSVDPGTHYTRVELRDLNQFLHGRTLGKVRDHLRDIYREFLRDDWMTLHVHNQAMKYDDPQILHAPDYRKPDGVERSWRKEFSFYLKSGLHVRGWAALRADFKTTGNGLSLFRRRRLILGTSESVYRPKSIYTKDSSFKSGRLFGEVHLDGLAVSHTKDAFQWQGQEEEFESRLRQELDSEPLPLLRQAENYRSKTSTRSDIQRMRDASKRTANASSQALPVVIPPMLDEQNLTSPEAPTFDRADGKALHAQEIVAEIEGRTWRVSFETRMVEGDERWLIRTTDVDSTTNDVRGNVTLNTAHPLFRDFAFASADAIGGIFRIGMSIVVSELLHRELGDGEVASRMVRQINKICAVLAQKVVPTS